jgi:hypothetical protein
MAAFDFSPAQAAASMAEGQQASVPIQSLLMQIDADAICLVRTQFQQINIWHEPLRHDSHHPKARTLEETTTALARARYGLTPIFH